MELLDAVLESWRRQVRIIDNISSLVTPDLMDAVSREGEWPIGQHLCHINLVRLEWLGDVSPQDAEGIPYLYTKVSEEKWVPSNDLDEIRATLGKSAEAVERAMTRLLPEGQPAGPYSHPLFYLQHMIWHEGWHASSLIHALRANGHEPSDEWDEEKIWAIWRS